MSVFFTSDTHFDHKRMAEWRRFDSVEEMNETIIENWNKVVRGCDTVYHLGDFFWKENIDIANRLNGNVNWVKGNHDYRSMFKVGRFNKITDSIHTIKIEEQPIVLCHYPLKQWNRQPYNVYHLHGHAHGCLKSRE
ncbi:metallophosphoesterase family protein [uncultured Arcobacter sp.]|uniref:metallophosphoesterase family protein n=1 Tax=uncultured Arcobacter sp. TaxID=165434 RepID=UPI00261C197C|nr:metallophosphoesterase family protein [uncultured Arcobacter sp.]